MNNYILEEVNNDFNCIKKNKDSYLTYTFLIGRVGNIIISFKRFLDDYHAKITSYLETLIKNIINNDLENENNYLDNDFIACISLNNKINVFCNGICGMFIKDKKQKYFKELIKGYDVKLFSINKKYVSFDYIPKWGLSCVIYMNNELTNVKLKNINNICDTKSVEYILSYDISDTSYYSNLSIENFKDISNYEKNTCIQNNLKYNLYYYEHKINKLYIYADKKNTKDLRNVIVEKINNIEFFDMLDIIENYLIIFATRYEIFVLNGIKTIECCVVSNDKTLLLMNKYNDGINSCFVNPDETIKTFVYENGVNWFELSCINITINKFYSIIDIKRKYPLILNILDPIASISDWLFNKEYFFEDSLGVIKEKIYTCSLVSTFFNGNIINGDMIILATIILLYNYCDECYNIINARFNVPKFIESFIIYLKFFGNPEIALTIATFLEGLYLSGILNKKTYDAIFIFSNIKYLFDIFLSRAPIIKGSNVINYQNHLNFIDQNGYKISQLLTNEGLLMTVFYKIKNISSNLLQHYNITLNE